VSGVPKASLVEIRGGLIPAPGRPSADPEETIAWEQIAPREIEAADWRRFEDSIAEIFTSFGIDLSTVATSATPARFLKAMYDATAGYEGDVKLLTAFPTEYHEGAASRISQVIEGPISFYSLCEHHALPFHGFAHVGYVAHEQIIGVSKLTRLVRLFARRFTVQQRLGVQIADTPVELMKPHGVAVHLEAEHLCTQMRGVREEHSKTVTSFWRGGYIEGPRCAASSSTRYGAGTLGASAEEERYAYVSIPDRWGRFDRRRRLQGHPRTRR
jgi:GTP cyclohydrolase IA